MNNDIGSGIWASQVTTTMPNWLWFPYIPIGEVTMFAAKGWTGKSTIICDLTARITTGGGFPTHHEKNLKGEHGVLYLTLEESLSSRTTPRLKAMQADLNKVMFSAKQLSFTDDNIPWLIEKCRAKLVVFDTWTAFLRAETDMNRSNAVRPVIVHLRDLAERFGCAIIIIHHFNKMSMASADERLSGSLDLVNAHVR